MKKDIEITINVEQGKGTVDKEVLACQLCPCEINTLLSNIEKMRKPGVVYVDGIYKAIRRSFEGEMTLEDMTQILNGMVAYGYLHVRDINGYCRYGTVYQNVVRDNYGKVIGVRW